MTATDTSTQAVAPLEGMARHDLAHDWRERFGAPLPDGLPDRLARLALAHAIQSGSRAPLPRRRRASPACRSTQSARRVSLRPGTVLVRDWHGQTHRVQVLDGGRFRWGENDWRSLSAIARAITGTRRSGPAFFGLVEGATQ